MQVHGGKKTYLMQNNKNSNLHGSSNFYHPIETSPPKKNAFVANTATSELANSTGDIRAFNNLNDTNNNNNNYLDCQI